MKLKLVFLLSSILYVLSFNGCVFTDDLQEKERIETLCQITEHKTTDSKIMGDKIISTTDGHLILFNFDGSIYKEYTDISANWIYTCDSENERLVAVGNFDYEIRIISFSKDYMVDFNYLVFNQENLMIDPTLVKQEDNYFLTFTEIKGNVNNGDESQTNGLYTVRCFISKDLKNWQKLSDIVSYYNNIEDGDLFVSDDGKNLNYLFEKEEYDKGPSSLNVISSLDQGKTWTDEKEIIPAIADNEPASIMKHEDGYTLYYSSDKEHMGSSYNEAAVYQVDLNKDFSVKNSYIPVELKEEKGILLYDVSTEGGLLFLYSQNYLTDNNLILKEIRVE